MKVLNHLLASRFSQINYDRELALILTEPGKPGRVPIHGVARFHADPDNDCAEFGIIVEEGFTGLGLGYMLMERLIDRAKARGIENLVGNVLPKNQRTLEMCRELAFQASCSTQEPDSVTVTLSLAQPENTTL